MLDRPAKMNTPTTESSFASSAAPLNHNTRIHTIQQTAHLKPRILHAHQQHRKSPAPHPHAAISQCLQSATPVIPETAQTRTFIVTRTREFTKTPATSNPPRLWLQLSKQSPRPLQINSTRTLISTLATAFTGPPPSGAKTRMRRFATSPPRPSRSTVPPGPASHLQLNIAARHINVTVSSLSRGKLTQVHFNSHPDII
jgi:hypothetical protein